MYGVEIFMITLFFNTKNSSYLECKLGGRGAMFSKMKEEILEGNKKHSKNNKYYKRSYK